MNSPYKANYTSFRLRGLTSFIKNAIVKQPFLKTRMVIGPKTGCSDHRLALVQLGQFCSGLDSLCINQIVFWMLFEVIMDLWSFSQTQKARFFGPKRSVKRGAMFSFRLQFYQNQKGSRREKEFYSYTHVWRSFSNRLSTAEWVYDVSRTLFPILTRSLTKATGKKNQFLTSFIVRWS